MRRQKFAVLGIAVALLLASCASSKDDDNASGDGDSTTTTPAAATGPAPGVTADTVKIGIPYVNAEALKAVGLNYNLGDWEGAAQALIDEINKEGVNGRKIEPVFAPIDPTGPTSAEEACLKLTEDEDVFLVTGFFLAAAVGCPVATHETATVGGVMTKELLEEAKAPWISWEAANQPENVTRALAERGELDGKVAVFTATADEGVMNDTVLPTLEDLGIDAVETGIMDAPTSDTAAIQSNVTLIAEKFEAAGADTVLIVGQTGANWPLYMAENPYKPKLLFLDNTASRAFATNESTTDTSILEGSLSGGPYGPDIAIYEEPEMQKCIATLEAAGLDVPKPNPEGNDQSDQPYQAAFRMCPAIALTHALLEAAGETLNYGTLTNAINGLQVTIPGDPAERTYGPPPKADGAPKAYLFTFNQDTKQFDLAD